MKDIFEMSSAQVFYNLIYRNILVKETNRFNKQIADISNRNIVLGATSSVMLLNGKTIYGAFIVKGQKPSPIHESLKSELESLVAARSKLAQDSTYISNCCSFIIPERSTLQDWRNIVSDVIANNIPQLSTYSRTDVEMYTILNKPVHMKQWEKASYLIEYYIGNILVFG